MKPRLLVLLAVFLLAVEAQDPASRTYGSHYYHGHAGHNHGVHTHGHHNHGVPHHPPHHVHQHGHPAHPHPSVHHQGPTHTGHGSHQHHAKPPTSDTLQSPLQAPGHPNHHHHHQQQHSSVPVQAATSVKTVPVMVCRIIQLPVGLEVKPVPTFVPKGQSPSRPQQVSIAASIGNVVGRVIHPVVALLNSPSGWFDHTTPGAHSHIAHHHRPHNFTVLNHTDHHGQSHNTRPHRNRLNFTAPNVGDVRNQLAGHGDVNRHQVCPFSVQTSPPAIVTEATTTPSPTPANPTTTVRVPILKSSLCGQDPAPHVPALRAYPFTVQDAAATSTDGSTAIPKEPTSEMYQEITTAGNTALPTTLTNVPLPFPEDRTEGTGPTSAAAMLLAESNTQYTPVPVGNEKVATTYSPTSDTVSSQSPVPSTTSVVPTTVRSPTSLNTTHTALPATRGVPTPPSAVESTSVVPEDAPDAASSGTVSFTTTSHRFV